MQLKEVKKKLILVKLYIDHKDKVIEKKLRCKRARHAKTLSAFENSVAKGELIVSHPLLLLFS